MFDTQYVNITLSANTVCHELRTMLVDLFTIMFLPSEINVLRLRDNGSKNYMLLHYFIPFIILMLGSSVVDVKKLARQEIAKKSIHEFLNYLLKIAEGSPINVFPNNQKTVVLSIVLSYLISLSNCQSPSVVGEVEEYEYHGAHFKFLDLPKDLVQVIDTDSFIKLKIPSIGSKGILSVIPSNEYPIEITINAYKFIDNDLQVRVLNSDSNINIWTPLKNVNQIVDAAPKLFLVTQLINQLKSFVKSDTYYHECKYKIYHTTTIISDY